MVSDGEDMYEDNARCELMWLDCRWQWMVNKDRLVYSYWTLSTEHPFALPHTNHPYNTHSNQNPHSLNHTKTYSSTPNVHCSEQCDVWLIFIQFLTMPFFNQCLKQFKTLHKQCIKRSTSPTPSKLRVVPTSKRRRWSCNFASKAGKAEPPWFRNSHIKSDLSIYILGGLPEATCLSKKIT